MFVGFCLYLSLDQLLDIFDSSYSFLARDVIDVLLGALRHGFAQHFFALSNSGASGLCAHRQLWKISARGPQLMDTCNAVSSTTYLRNRGLGHKWGLVR